MPRSRRFLTVKISHYDIERFAEVVIDLLKDEKKRKEIGDKSRKFAESLSWEKLVK